MTRWRVIVLRGFLTAVFAGAGVVKALNPAEFAFAIDRYRLVPWPAAAGLALYLPWLEIFAAIALWPRATRAGARVVLIGLCGAFLVALGSAWGRGLDIDCGCFGSATTSLPWATARVAVLLGALGLLGRWDRVGDQGGNKQR